MRASIQYLSCAKWRGYQKSDRQDRGRVSCALPNAGFAFVQGVCHACWRAVYPTIHRGTACRVGRHDWRPKSSCVSRKGRPCCSSFWHDMSCNSAFRSQISRLL